MNRNRKTKVINIFCIIFVFIFTFTHFSIGGIENEKLHQNADLEDTQVNNNQDIKVVTISSTDQLITNGQHIPQDNNISPLENAAPAALGYIQAGKSKDEIFSILTDMGYTETEAEIAYSKANASLQPTDSIEPNQAADQNTDQITNNEAEEVKPTLSAKERVKQDLGEYRPRRKFRTFSDRRKVNEGAELVTKMQEEGYSLDEIAEGLYDNGYSTKNIATMFKKAGVSAADTYTALSKIEIQKAENSVDKQRPSAKFKRRNGKNWEAKWGQVKTERKAETKQEAVIGVLNDMKSAGYDIKGSLDGAVQDLKDTGMSVKDVYSKLIGTVAEGKPTSKFRSRRLFASLFARYKKPNMESHGDGEVALAAAMMKAGYSNTEIQAAFENKNGKFYGRYSYTDSSVVMIMSKAQGMVNQQNEQLNSTNNIDNTNTQQDIIKRQTQSTPI